MAVRLSLVVTTVGRVPEVVRLARSIAGSPNAAELELIVVDQSADCRVVTAVGELAPAIRWRGTTSPRGASLGRNTGLRLATGDLVGFPNDNTWYPPDTLPRMVARFDENPGLGGLCVPLSTADGRPAMLRWPDRAVAVDRRNFYRTGVMPGMFFRRALVTAAGGLDETIGTGASGPAQSGEESDLLLRVLADGARVDYEPAIVVHNDEPRDRLDVSFVAKMRRYGVGQGYLWRRHHLSRALLGGLVARKAVAVPVRLARGERLLARADVAWAHGCLTGYLGRSA
ncbi:MAG: glycosyl transferase, family 2 [Frankiales bacterium]|nr:glycosyl transferase, family 2 [Frankiales bacterium]